MKIYVWMISINSQYGALPYDTHAATVTQAFAKAKAEFKRDFPDAEVTGFSAVMRAEDQERDDQPWRT